MSEAWATDDDLRVARERFAAQIPGLVMPVAYGVARRDRSGLTFGHVNRFGEVRPLPAVVLASVCGYVATTGVFRLDRARFAEAIAWHDAYLPPVVVAEALSNPFLSQDGAERIRALPVIDLLDGYWIRAGEMRADLLRQQRKAKLGDALIAQICLDYGSPLVTFDDDFDNFVDLGLILL